MKRRPLRPEIEAIESRQLLSGMGAITHPQTPGLVEVEKARPVRFVGTFRGTFIEPFDAPDVGKLYDLSGSGKAGRLGRFGAQGSLHTTGFIATGHASGTLTLSGRSGRLTLDLTGPTQPGFAGLPDQFTFVVSGGTGRFVHANGSVGTAMLTLSNVQQPGAGGALSDGKFALVLKS